MGGRLGGGVRLDVLGEELERLGDRRRRAAFLRRLQAGCPG